jgi:glucokinase
VPGPAARCYCGLSTCWEQLASRPALDALTGDATAQLGERALAGDARALAVFDTYGEHVGTGTSTLLTIHRPQHLVFGGGAARTCPSSCPVCTAP